jgi:hypothetical protein
MAILLTAARIGEILDYLDVDSVRIGNKITATRMATKDKIIFKIEHQGKQDYLLKDATPNDLAEISQALWNKLGPRFFSGEEAALDELLTPEELKEPVDALAGTLEELTPDQLREKKDPLAGTLDGLLTPEELRDPAPAGQK